MDTFLERYVRLKTGMGIAERLDYHEERRSTIPEIAEEFECHLASVYRLMKQHGKVIHTTLKSRDEAGAAR